MAFKQYVLITMFLIALLPMSFADEGSEFCTYLTEDLGLSAGLEIPGYIPYSNEVANVYIGANESLVGTIVLEESVITEINCGEAAESPTYDLKIESEETIQDIITAESPADALSDKMSNDEIVIDGRSFSKSTKSFFTGLLVTIGSWFF